MACADACDLQLCNVGAIGHRASFGVYFKLYLCELMLANRWGIIEHLMLGHLLEIIMRSSTTHQQYVLSWNINPEVGHH